MSNRTRELAISDHERMRFTVHEDGTISLRMDSSRMFDLLRDASSAAVSMQAHVGRSGDQYRMWRASELMWRAARATLALATGRYWAFGDESDARAELDRWDDTRTPDGQYPMADGAPGYSI